MVVCIACAASIEAVQAYVQAARVVDAVEAAGAVFPVDGLSRTRRLQRRVVDVLARHFKELRLRRKGEKVFGETRLKLY